MDITEHGQDRGRERVGLNLKALERILPKVLRSGVSSADVKGKIYKYLSALHANYPRKGNNIRIYGEHVYVFIEEKLITVLDLPNEMKDYKKYLKN